MKKPRWFQVEGAEFLAARKGALLADEPRVGKTFSAILAADKVKARIVIIVVPAHLKEGWKREIADCQRGHWIGIIVSYNKLKELLVKLKRLDRDIDAVIFDEAHYIKERTAQRTRAALGGTCSRLGGIVERAKRIWFLTGTPLPKNPADIWTMLRASAPHLIADPKRGGRPMNYSAFESRYCKKIYTGFGWKVVGGKNFEELRRKLRDFMLRRTRREVFGRDILPPTKLFITASAEDMRGVRAFETSEQGKRLAAAIARGDTSALRRQNEGDNLRKIVGLAKLPGLVAELKMELDTEPEKKLVLFCFHHDTIDAYRAALAKYHPIVYDGRTPPAKRMRLRDMFQESKKHRIIIGQISAMNVGNDLSAANDVVFAEFSYVGDDNEQARARVFNMNKDEPCFTRYAILPGTMDEQVWNISVGKLTTSGKVLS